MTTYVLLIIVSFLLNACKEEEVQSAWVRSPVTVDGDVDEWKDSPFVVLEDEHLALSLANDSEYLYLAARTSDATNQRLIQRAGVTLMIDPEGGSDENIEIHFPAGGSMSFRENRGGFWESMTEEERARALKQVEEMRGGILVVDHQKSDSHVYPAKSASGFGAGISDSQGLLTFEARIPIHIEKYVEGYKPLGAAGTVGVGIKMSRTRSPESREFAERPGGFGGPRSGRGRGGGGMGRPPGGRRPSEGPSDVWLSVTLANGK